MKIEINNTTKSKVDFDFVKKVTEEFLRKYKKTTYEVSIGIVGDAAMRKLNKTYRKTDKPTDVLTFSGEEKFLGEIIIDYAQIERQAKKEGHRAKYELAFILMHGLLHLVGYDDNTDKKRLEMIKAGEKFLNKLKVKK